MDMRPNRTFRMLPLAFGVMLTTAGIAQAQAMSFAGIDTDSDGMLSEVELEAAFGANAALAMQQYDLDRDGMVAIEEASRVASRGTVGAESGLAAMPETAKVDGEDIPDELMTAKEAVDAAEARQAEVGASGAVEAVADTEMSGS